MYGFQPQPRSITYPLPVGAPTVLALAAAALGAGAWTTLTCNYPTTLADLVDSGGGKRITEYADKMVWDSTRKRVYFTGQGHLQTMKTIQYDDATNAWSNVGTPPWWSAGMFFHGYGHNALIGDTHYVLQYGTTTVRSRDIPSGNTSWSTIDTTGVALGSDGAIGALEYFPSYGSGGSLIIVDGNGDGLFRRNAGSWTNIGTPVIGGNSNFGVYTPIKDLMYLGGGSASSAIYTLSNTGTLTAKTSAPVGIGVVQSVNTVDPVSGKFIAITLDKTVRVFDPVADSWGTDTAPDAGFWSDSIYTEGEVMGILACPVPDYGVTLFLTLGSSTIYLRKGRA